MPSVTVLAHRMATGGFSGVQRYRTELVRALASGGDWWPSTASLRETQQPAWLPGGVVHHHVPGPRAVVGALLVAGVPWRLDRHLGRPDVVHVAAPWLPVPTSAPRVVTLHDLFVLEHPGWFPRGQRLRTVRGLRHAAAEAARLVCVSSHVADRAARLLGVEPGRLTVVHSGIDERFRRPPTSEAVASCCERYGLEPGRYLVALGVMSAREDPSVVLDALLELPRDLLGPRALVATGPVRPGADAVARGVATRGLADRVVLPGFVPEEELVPLLAGARALVHPARAEGFGFVPLEAMAVGTPVVVSRAGSLPEVVADAGVLVDPDDPDAWAAAISTLVTDDAHHAEMRARGLIRQADFTWSRTAAATAAVYEGARAEARQ